MVVVLIGFGKLVELEFLADAVEDRGGDVVLCDVNDWPGATPLSFVPGDETAVFGSDIRFEDVTGSYVVSHQLFRPYDHRRDDLTEGGITSVLAQLREYRGLFESFCRTLEYHNANVIPALHNHHWQERKPWQLYLYETNSVPIPDTLLTNSRDAVQEFYETYDRVIYKQITRGGSPHRLTEEDLNDEKLDRLATAPVLFQEYVEGEEFRVYVLDGEIVGAVRYESKRLSYKHDQNVGGDIDVRGVTLPPNIENTITRAANLAELTFAAADIIQRPNGKHVLLELNEAPRFAAPDDRGGQDVTGALADYLLDG